MSMVLDNSSVRIVTIGGLQLEWDLMNNGVSVVSLFRLDYGQKVKKLNVKIVGTKNLN